MYCTASNISSVIPKTKLRSLLGLSGDGDVPDEDVAEFIEVADREIDAALGSRYQIPITGDASLAMITSFSAVLAAEAIYGFYAEGNLPTYIKDRATRVRQQLDYYAGVNGNPSMHLPDAPTHFSYAMRTSNAVDVTKVLGELDYGDEDQ